MCSLSCKGLVSDIDTHTRTRTRTHTADNSIGIFPEGGSHDRTELLPLKAGVTLMALGAVEKYKVPVKIVPCGLNYFFGHKFRYIQQT
jgi:glycerol-3-phosphate O-acyltransferase/dihydroxyacetone phosphate acyltransferase